MIEPVRLLLIIIFIVILCLLVFIICKKNSECFGNNKKTIVVFPSCGLGNRLLVMSSSYELARELDCDLKFFWSNCQGCKCEWNDIFGNELFGNELPFIKDAQEYSDKIYYTGNDMEWAKEKGKLFNFRDENVFHSKKYKVNRNILSCTMDIGENSKFYKSLTPSKQVKKRLYSFWKPPTDRVLGLHIRFTDNKAAENNSERDIIGMAQNKIEEHPGFSIFIASDNQKIKDTLINNNKNIFYQNTDIRDVGTKMMKERSTLEGMYTSVADMFALSMCNVIWSTDPDSTFYKSALKMSKLTQ